MSEAEPGFTALPGRGARAAVDGRTLTIGSPRLFRELGINLKRLTSIKCYRGVRLPPLMSDMMNKSLRNRSISATGIQYSIPILHPN